MGARGGKTAAKRWNDPESEYARQQRAALAAANETRSYSTDENKGRLLALIASYRRQGLPAPSTSALAQELGLSERRVRELRRLLGMTAPRGRPRKTAELLAVIGFPLALPRPYGLVRSMFTSLLAVLDPP